MGGKKRKTPNELDSDGAAADDLGYDLRLDRRLKRRYIANKDTKLDSVAKTTFDQGNNYPEALKEIEESNSVNRDIDNDSNDNFVDADYKKYLDSLSSTPTGDHRVRNSTTFDSRDDDEKISMQTDALNNLQSNNIASAGNRGDLMDVSYPSCLDVLAPQYGNAFCINGKPDVSFVDGFAQTGDIGEELVGNEFMDTDADVFNEKKSNSDCMDDVADSIENEDSGCVDVGAGSSQTRSADNHTCQNDDLDNTDPDYGFFLKNMLTDWNGSSFNSSKDSGHIDVDTSQNDDSDDRDDDLSPKDGKEDENGAFCNLPDGGSFQTRSGNNDTSQNDDLDSNDPDYEFFLKNIRQDGTSFVLEIPECDGISQVIKYEVGDGCRVENPGTSRSSQEGSVECNLLDESYDKFLNALKNERGLVVYVPENGPKVVYDEDEEESSSDSDLVILETNPIPPSYEIILSDDEEMGSNKAVSERDCWFRDKVIEILKQPFDQAEYDRLLFDVTDHKPVIVDRDMRNGRSRKLVVNNFGKSYLDVHKDLARKINSTRSQPKVLNLLRGFFFWLQNTPHGVFKPWEDKLCLQVPPSEAPMKKEYIH
ncbi:hypothetical protein M5689_024221 [Euphorbia peplus]|nr:hypothetical protein M5689_024221 [Euphorbia peplus]